MSTSMQSSVLLSDLAPSEHHSDSTESHESPPEQKSGVIYLIKTALAARFGFFSPDSLKTVSTFINLVPTEVTALLQIRSTSLFRQSSGIDDRSLAFQNGIKYLAYNPESRWTKSLQDVAIGHVLVQPSLPLSGELTTPSSVSRNLPALQEAYQVLLQFEGNGSRADHPYGVSSLLFTFASLLSLSIHRPTSTVRNQPSCFDLSPLYGLTSGDAQKIRLNDGTGMLAPDCFCEDRVALLPPAVSAMLILWNRNHNFIAKRLSISCVKIFKNQDSKDEHIFQTARLINCANFRNVIAIDFLKGLMGLSAADPNPNVNVLSDSVEAQDLKTFPESIFCYNWSSSISQDDASRLENTMARMLGVENGELPNVGISTQFGSSLQIQTSEIDNDLTRRSYPGLPRPLNGRFKDKGLADVLQSATTRSACAFGYRQVPFCAQDLELRKIEEARDSNARSLNDYRKCLGLKPHKTFIDWNSNIEIAQHAEQLYKNIDDLELYVGLHAEEAVPCGFGLGYTMTYGLLTDLVSRIRSDLALAKITEHAVTPWGYQDCQIHFNNGAFGNVFPKLLMRNLPRHYPHNNVYTLFPFCTPSAAVDCLKQNLQLPDDIDHSDYDCDAPKQPIVHTLTTRATISHVLNAFETYNTPYGEHFKKITDGYGYFLGFDDEALHDRDQIMTLHALIPDSEATLRRYAATMSSMTEKAIITKRNSSVDSEVYTIDIVKDVINPVCTQWVCQTLCDYKLRCEKPDSGQAEDTSHMSDEEIHEAFAALYTYVFRNSEPEQGWDIHQKAMRASKILRGHIRDKIPRPKWLQPSSHLWWPWLQICIDDYLRYFKTVRIEFSSEGRKLPQFSAQTFLERLVQGRRNISIGDLHPSLEEIHKRVKPLHWEDENDLKDQELEVSRIVANVLGLAIVTSVNFPMTLIQAIDFYMDEKRTEERAEIIRLSNLEFPSAKDNARLMGYIREAQRIDQPLGLWRNVVRDDDIPQGSNGHRIHVCQGDRIFVDLQKSHSNPPDIDENRKTPSIQGLGLHKCPALSFIDKTMPEMFKIIFQLPGVRRGPGDTGRLIKIKHIADPLDSDPIAFVNQAKELSFVPQNLILEYDADPNSVFGAVETEMSEKEQNAWMKMTSVVSRHEKVRNRIDWTLKGIVVVRLLWTLLNLLLSLQAAFYGMWRTKKTIRPVRWEDVKREDIQCPEPIKPWHNWEAVTMAAGDGVPEALNYTSNNSTAHRLSVFDADKRDMRMAIYVDNILRGLTSDFDLNLEEDCGVNVYMCARKNFSGGLLVVPAGKHEVSIQWNGKEFVNDTHEPDLGKNTSRRLFWERVDCAS